jgi:hypothetical protein
MFDIFESYLKRTKREDWIGRFSKESMLNFESKEISFETWDGLKLISYWYDEYLLFFELIAPYIDGSVVWRFETNDEGGKINFVDGRCEIEFGIMNWVTSTPLEQLGDEKEIDTELNKEFMLRKLEK